MLKHVTTLACAMAISGCASIISKSEYPIIIDSTPSGATVLIKDRQGRNVHRAQTPTTVTLKSGDGFFKSARYSFEFEKEGYQPTISALGANLDPWYFGNILFGGLIGMLIVDPATGAMWKLEDRVTANLHSDGRTITARTPSPAPAAGGTSASPASEAPGSPTLDQYLQYLDTQLKQGAITQAEYERRRAILSGMDMH